MNKKQGAKENTEGSSIHRNQLLLSIGLIVFITVLVFLPIFQNGFTNWDDDKYVIENPLIRELSIGSIGAMFSTFIQGNYHPLTILSLALDFHFFELNPHAYQFTNLLLHVLNALLVFWLTLKLSKRISTSLLVGLLFGIHPLHVESVAWISERKDLLYSFFFLSSLICYIFFIERNKRIKYYLLSLALFALSCLSKGLAVTLPVILILIDYYLGQRMTWSVIREKIPFILISTIFGVLAIIAQRAVGAVGTSIMYSISDNVFIAFHGIAFYFVKMILPLDLSSVYPYPMKTDSTLSLKFFLSPLFVLAAGWIVFVSRKKTRVIVFGSLFYLVSIIPVLQLLPVGDAIGADRYFYISSIGLFFIVATGFDLLLTRKAAGKRILQRLLKGVAIGVIVFFGILTVQRCQVWKDSITLFSDVVEKHPEFSSAYVNLGKAYGERGEYEKSLKALTMAVQLVGSLRIEYYNMGNEYFQKRSYDKSLRCYEKVIEIDSTYAKAYYGIAAVYGELNDDARKIENLQRAARMGHEPSQQWLRENRIAW